MCWVSLPRKNTGAQVNQRGTLIGATLGTSTMCWIASGWGNVQLSICDSQVRLNTLDLILETIVVFRVRRWRLLNGFAYDT